jgi:hypothetical protein
MGTSASSGRIGVLEVLAQQAAHLRRVAVDVGQRPGDRPVERCELGRLAVQQFLGAEHHAVQRPAQGRHVATHRRDIGPAGVRGLHLLGDRLEERQRIDPACRERPDRRRGGAAQVDQCRVGGSGSRRCSAG